MLPMALVLVILMVPSYLASNSNQYYYGAAHMFGENTRLGADTAAIEETFGRSDTYWCRRATPPRSKSFRMHCTPSRR